MKLLKLEIKDYKNLDFSIDFEDGSPNYLTIIGLNGTGKSNVLEALGIIFKEHATPSYKYTYKNNFNYLLNYEINGVEIVLEKGKMLANNMLVVKEKQKFLPKIIASYSGEETRLWDEVFFGEYQNYFKKVKKNTIGADLNFLYVNKYSWDKALLTLLCHPIHQQPILDLLDAKIEDMEVLVNFNDKYTNYKNDYASGFSEFINFIKRIKGILSWNETIENDVDDLNSDSKSLEINSFTTLDLGNISHSTQPNEWCRRLFNYLFLATMPKTKKIINSIEIKFGNKSLSVLSEGQKKIILVQCISKILADENTVMLFDEPDSHVHLDRKQDIIEAVSSSKGISIVTTHSPTLVNYADVQSLYKLADGKLEKIQESYEGLSHLVSQKELQKIFFSTKDIIICEGKTDEIYINKAIETFRNDYPNLNFEFILSGGTDIDNLNKLLFQITTNNNVDRKIIVLVDRDDAGLKVYKGLNIGSSDKQHLELVDVPGYPNTKFLMLPVTEDFSPSSNFVIEDYFGTETLRKLAIQLIQNEFKNNSSYTKFPKIKDDIKQKHLKKFCEEQADSDSLKGFKTLLNTLNRVVENSA